MRLCTNVATTWSKAHFLRTVILLYSNACTILYNVHLFPRVSAEWRRLLAKVYGTNHFAVNVAALQRKFVFGNDIDAIGHALPASVEEWFASQEGLAVQRNIFFYGTSILSILNSDEDCCSSFRAALFT